MLAIMSGSSRLLDFIGGETIDRTGPELERIRTIGFGALAMVAIGLPFSVQYMKLGLWSVAIAVWATCFAGLMVIWLIRAGFSLTLCGYLSGTVLYLLLLISNLNSGGFYDPNFAWFYVVPLVGAVWVDAKAAVFWSAVVIATTIVFWAVSRMGIVIPDNVPASVHPIQSLLNRLSALVALAVLITLFVRAHNRSRADAYRLAHFDDLTSLPNRRGLMKRLARELAAAEDEEVCALLFIDLDRFKTVNDSLGHRAGDKLLCAVAERLASTVAEFDEGSSEARMVSRFGGDEFAVVAGRLREPQVAGRLGRKIVEALAEPVKIDDYQLHTGASVGVALSPRDGTNADELLRSADLAMYEAKHAGGMDVAFCNQELIDASKRWMEVDAGLRRAIEDDELTLVFQPIVCLETRLITGVEALLRWTRADGEAVSPSEFIPVAEATGAILEIGEWVLRHARAAAREIYPLCDSPIRISVNLSVAQLRAVDLAASIIELVDDDRLPTGWLELELTESILLDDFHRITDLMSELGAHGVEFAIDDFGTGYSSLSYIAGLPANRLKVDREFVTTATADKRQREVTNAIFAMAERLGLPTVAEGIETEDAANLVRELGCTEGQGNFFSRPLPLPALLELITNEPIVDSPQAEPSSLLAN